MKHSKIAGLMAEDWRPSTCRGMWDPQFEHHYKPPKKINEQTRRSQKPLQNVFLLTSLTF